MTKSSITNAATLPCINVDIAKETQPRESNPDDHRKISTLKFPKLVCQMGRLNNLDNVVNSLTSDIRNVSDGHTTTRKLIERMRRRSPGSCSGCPYRKKC